MGEATPRPWRAVSAGMDDDKDGPAWVAPMGGVSLPLGYDGEFLNRADADLIVRAVNAHDELVAALHALALGLHEGEEWHDQDGCPGDDTCDCRLPSVYRAALKKAGANV